jgi:hypothetical protein
MKSFFYTVSFCFLLSAANAQVLQDNFGSYTTGSDLNGQGGWSNNTSNPGGAGNCAGAICDNQKVTATALSFANYGSSSKSITCSPGRDGVGKGWATNITSGSVYASFLVNFSDVLCNGSCSSEFGFFRLVNRGSNFSFVVRMLAKKTTASSFQFGVDKGGGGNKVFSANSYNLNTTLLVVLKYTINTGSNSDDLMQVFVNPDMSLPEPASPDINSNLGTDLTSIDIAAAQFNFNSVGILPVGNYGLLSVATAWNQLPHTAAAVNNIDRDLSNAKVFATSSTQAVFQMSSTRADNITIEMTDVMGRVVLRQQAKLNAGTNSFVMQTTTLSKGIYNVRAVSSKGVSSTVRFMQ